MFVAAFLLAWLAWSHPARAIEPRAGRGDAQAKAKPRQAQPRPPQPRPEHEGFLRITLPATDGGKIKKD